MDHYLYLLPNRSSTAIMSEALTKAPTIKGFLKHYPWAALEQEKDVYDFRTIESDRAFLAERGKVLIPMIADKTFVAGTNNCPAHVRVEANNPGGTTAVRWDPSTREAFTNLLAVLAARFSGEEGFRGIATQETAPGLTASQLVSTSYTPETYVDYYLELAERLNREGVLMYWHANYMPQKQAGIGDVLKNATPNLMLGGPDNWPDNKSLVDRMYPFYKSEFIRTKFIGHSPDSYNYTYKDLMANAKLLGVSEILWVYTPRFRPEYVV